MRARETVEDASWLGFSAYMKGAGLWGDPLARLMTGAARSDPYPEYARLRRRTPLARSVFGAVTARHDVTNTVLRDHERFSSAPTRRSMRFGARPPHPEAPPDLIGAESMIGMDPPEHTRIRRVVGSAFTRRAIERLRPRIEAVATRLLDDIDGDAPTDLMSAFADVLPVVLISELLGIPESHRDAVKRWGDDLAATLDVVAPAAQRRAEGSVAELHAYLLGLLEDRRQDAGELVIDNLLAAEAAGTLTNRELMATAMLLLTAGFETTVNLIGNGVLALLQHPDQLARLLREPDLVADGVEEILRWDSPVQSDARVARVDTELDGIPVPRGRSVIVLLGGANRDPAVFPDPETFDVARSNASQHLAFAAGPHYCIGAALARLEGEIALRALLDRFPVWQLAADPVRREGFTLRGLACLPVRLRRARTFATGA